MAGTGWSSIGRQLRSENTATATFCFQHQAAITGWAHVAVVYENKQPKLYINGALVKTRLTSSRSNVRIYPWDIGGMVYGYYQDQLDDVRLYSGVVVGEIRQTTRRLKPQIRAPHVPGGCLLTSSTYTIFI